MNRLHTDKQTGRHTNTYANGSTDKHNRLVDGGINEQTDRQPHKQTDKLLDETD